MNEDVVRRVGYIAMPFGLVRKWLSDHQIWSSSAIGCNVARSMSRIRSHGDAIGQFANELKEELDQRLKDVLEILRRGDQAV